MQRGRLFAKKTAIQELGISEHLPAPRGTVFSSFTVDAFFFVGNPADGGIEQIRKIALITP